ncbi:MULTISPECIES: thioredoxin family protein [Clostridium]|jgi:thiol-disulfide isomerase/thioredoxin|uniref:Thioredoxin-like protein YtpP n=2 Tax=Clostridium TaxID=1485 RepID=A0A151AQR2_9CLOT|nr:MULTISPECIES: thioredoxin family protein [Clostridium]KYH29989.1 thioredoxin-like protein YtpP [Clostridium colicanis DSM 13634]MBE6044195.1 thioredoxin family protein [Clostridium thermopalmarium]PRR75913.1 Thioredoxin-like protein YtpP [Clostridium thermopalmarium DSM 5974]PVZ24490.1 thioredoxin [Clostridium thermopalmarium DSM 5974]
MDKLNSIEEVRSFIKENSLALLYISTGSCAVCHALLPKVKEMLLRYPNIIFRRIDIDEITEACGEFSVFTVPAIIFYIESKEVIRKARFISINELESSIRRYYYMLNEGVYGAFI